MEPGGTWIRVIKGLSALSYADRQELLFKSDMAVLTMAYEIGGPGISGVIVGCSDIAQGKQPSM